MENTDYGSCTGIGGLKLEDWLLSENMMNWRNFLSKRSLL